MTTQQELAVLIRKGLESEDVVESHESFFSTDHGTFYVCALGAALVGKFGSAEKVNFLQDEIVNV